MTSAEEFTQSPPDEFHLACLLLSPAGRIYLGGALDAVDPDDFYDPTLGWIWGLARTIHATGQPVTKRLLAAAAEADHPPHFATSASRDNSKFRGRRALSWLERVAGEPVYPARLQSSIRAVRATAQMRRLIQATDRIKQRASLAEDYSQALGMAWEELRQLDGSDLPAEVAPFSTLVDDFHKAMATGLTIGKVVPTPWPQLNDLLAGGLHPGRSFVVAGRPGAGKSIVGLRAAAQAAEEGFPTLVISEEMSAFEVTGRLMAAGAQVEYGEIVRFDMTAWTAQAVTEYGETNRDMPLYVIDRPNLTIEYVAAVARTMKRTKGLDLLVIDYLQLLDATDKSKVREQQVSHISRSVKLLSKELGCAIITLAQLNRDNVKSNRRPTIADLRESGSLEQDSDGVILLHHDETDDGRPTGMVTLILAKNRFGRTDDVELRWRGHQARIG